MGHLGIITVLCLALMLLLHDTSASKKGSSSKKYSTKTSSSASSNKGSNTQTNYPRQPKPNPAGGSYPAGGGGYPTPGGYPVRTGQPGGYPSMGGSYPNWNPNNKILSPRYGGGFGGPGYGIGGSPFSKTVQNMGYMPSVKSKGFAKKAVVAAGVGAMTGMAVGYGVGRIPRPHFHFSSRQEEHYYNHYMHQRYGKKSANTNDRQVVGENAFKPPPQAQTYEKYMDNCMNRSDLLQNRHEKISIIQGDNAMNGSLEASSGISERVGTAENGTTNVPVPVESQESNDDTVSITEIGYPALIQQMKARKCVELYMVYSESFLQNPRNRSDLPGNLGFLVLLITAFMSLSNAFLWQ